MDYKKAYEEALEKARYIKENCDCVNAKDIGSLFEQVFPELKESEDEKIRKGLIKGLSAMRDIHHHQTFSDDAINIDYAIAWLEKQGEQKTAWSEEDEMFLYNIIKDIDQLKRASKIEQLSDVYDKEISWLKSLKPQSNLYDIGYNDGYSAAKYNHWKPTEEQMEIIGMILTNESMDDNIARILRELKEQLEKL